MTPSCGSAMRTAYSADLRQLRQGHRMLQEVEFAPGLPFRGYNNRTLHVDLHSLTATERPVPDHVKRLFVGGRGFGLWYLWHATTPASKWSDPENAIVIAPGPLAGNTQYAGSGKSAVVTLSPLTGIPVDCNVGGSFGPLLKFCGFDALEIRGNADRPILIVIDAPTGRITFEEAPEETADSHLAADIFTRMYADDKRDRLNVSVVSAGRGADHSYMGCLNFSWWDPKRGAARLKQAARGGPGTVFCWKNLKALVVHGPRLRSDMNRAADFKRTVKVGRKITNEIHEQDDEQNRMRKVGTAHLIEVMDAYDLLPVHNFQYGAHADVGRIASDVWQQQFTQGTHDGCWYGCQLACSKGADCHVVRTGPYAGHIVTVNGPEYASAAALGSNCGIFDPVWVREANFYCDTYGIDSISFGTAAAFAMECYQRGILDATRTGGLDLAWGNAESQLELLHQMARGEGFGVVVGLGVSRMQALFGARGWGAIPLLRDIGMQVKGLEYSPYVSKESVAQQGGYALANKGPQHDEAWLIFMDVVNNQIPTPEEQAEMLHYFPLFRTWFGLMGLCKLPWNDVEPPTNAATDEPHKVPEHVDNYLELYAGITGTEISRSRLIEMSEAVYTFQRMFNLRMGKGRRADDLPPYRSMGPVTPEEYESRAGRYDAQLREILRIDPGQKTCEEKIALHRRWREARYDALVDAVYRRRGWSADGVPTPETLKRLQLDFPWLLELLEPRLRDDEVAAVDSGDAVL